MDMRPDVLMIFGGVIASDLLLDFNQCYRSNKFLEKSCILSSCSASLILVGLPLLMVYQLLSVNSHINCIVAHCLINVFFISRHVPLSGHDDVALFE